MKRDEAERRLKALEDFRLAYVEVLAELLTGTAEDGALHSFGTPKPGRGPEYAAAFERVDLLSMKAARAFDAAGVGLDYSPSGTHAYQRVNPALLWQITLQRDSWYPPAVLNQLINRAIGRLEDLRDDPLPDSNRAGGRSGLGWSSLSKAGKWLAGVITGIVIAVAAGGILFLLGWLGNGS
jgi:hypothetical protein